MDSIQIKDLEIYCHHGVLQEETVLGQKFLVSLFLCTDTGPAGKTDDLEQTVDYAEVCHFVKEQMEKQNFKLIEAAAEHLAQEILLAYPLVGNVQVEIKKPWAPILLPLDTVSVKIERGWTTAYLSIGSNMGDREKHLREALDALQREPTIRGIRVSGFQETEPYGYKDQDRFLNAAVELKTTEQPQGLWRILRRIEAEGKRERTVRWGPRTIDLDIVLFGDVVMNHEELIIPHREMHLREFVLRPLSEIAPWARHPVYHKTVNELLELCLQRDHMGRNEEND